MTAMFFHVNAKWNFLTLCFVLMICQVTSYPRQIAQLKDRLDAANEETARLRKLLDVTEEKLRSQSLRQADEVEYTLPVFSTFLQYMFVHMY